MPSLARDRRSAKTVFPVSSRVVAQQTDSLQHFSAREQLMSNFHVLQHHFLWGIHERFPRDNRHTTWRSRGTLWGDDSDEARGCVPNYWRVICHPVGVSPV